LAIGADLASLALEEEEMEAGVATQGIEAAMLAIPSGSAQPVTHEEIYCT
jgi:hypothetical protein